MRNETMLYLIELQEKTNRQNEIFIDPDEKFNQGYLLGRKLAVNDVLTAIRKLENEN